MDDLKSIFPRSTEKANSCQFYECIRKKQAAAGVAVPVVGRYVARRRLPIRFNRQPDGPVVSRTGRITMGKPRAKILVIE